MQSATLFDLAIEHVAMPAQSRVRSCSRVACVLLAVSSLYMLLSVDVSLNSVYAIVDKRLT